MTINDLRYKKYKFLLQYGKIISDNEINNLRVRVIEYEEKRYVHLMKNGECISVRVLPN